MLNLRLTQTDRLRMQLGARERAFRIGDLRRLLAKHRRDPDYAAACQTWRRELLSLREEQLRPWESVGDLEQGKKSRCS
jgi:hypothetical protein